MIEKECAPWMIFCTINCTLRCDNFGSKYEHKKKTINYGTGIHPSQLYKSLFRKTQTKNSYNVNDVFDYVIDSMCTVCVGLCVIRYIFFCFQHNNRINRNSSDLLNSIPIHDVTDSFRSILCVYACACVCVYRIFFSIFLSSFLIVSHFFHIC